HSFRKSGRSSWKAQTYSGISARAAPPISSDSTGMSRTCFIHDESDARLRARLPAISLICHARQQFSEPEKSQGKRAKGGRSVWSKRQPTANTLKSQPVFSVLRPKSSH